MSKLSGASTNSLPHPPADPPFVKPATKKFITSLTPPPFIGTAHARHTPHNHILTVGSYNFNRATTSDFRSHNPPPESTSQLSDFEQCLHEFFVIHHGNHLSCQDIEATPTNTRTFLTRKLPKHHVEVNCTGIPLQPSTALISTKQHAALVKTDRKFNGRVTRQTFSVSTDKRPGEPNRLTILAVYGPATAGRHRDAFWLKLANYIRNLRANNHYVIVSGDINLAPTAKDRCTNKTYDNEAFTLKTFLKQTHLVDSFREMNPPHQSILL